jgi:hypothetical protein
MIENESKIRKVLFNEISFLIAGIGLLSSVMFWVMNPQQELEKQMAVMNNQIENNLTVAASLEKIKSNDLNEIQIKLQNIEDRQLDLIKAVARLEAKHQ